MTLSSSSSSPSPSHSSYKINSKTETLLINTGDYTSKAKRQEESLTMTMEVKKNHLNDVGNDVKHKNHAAGGGGGATATEDSGIVKACDLIQKILDQVALGDSPPVNDGMALQEGATLTANSPVLRTTNSSGSTASMYSLNGDSATSHQDGKRATAGGAAHDQKYSRQRHIVPPVRKIDAFGESISIAHSTPVKDAARGGISPENANGSSLSPRASFLESHYREDSSPHVLSETKMGNVGLASLCARTLDSVATRKFNKPKPIIATAETDPSSPLVEQPKAAAAEIPTSKTVRPSPIKAPVSPTSPTAAPGGSTSPTKRRWFTFNRKESPEKMSRGGESPEKKGSGPATSGSTVVLIRSPTSSNSSSPRSSSRGRRRNLVGRIVRKPRSEQEVVDMEIEERAKKAMLQENTPPAKEAMVRPSSLGSAKPKTPDFHSSPMLEECVNTIFAIDSEETTSPIKSPKKTKQKQPLGVDTTNTVNTTSSNVGEESLESSFHKDTGLLSQQMSPIEEMGVEIEAPKEEETKILFIGSPSKPDLPDIIEEESDLRSVLTGELPTVEQPGPSLPPPLSPIQSSPSVSVSSPQQMQHNSNVHYHQQQQHQQGRRMQMFASEYARFLTATPFSPPIPRTAKSSSRSGGLMSMISRPSGRSKNQNAQKTSQYQSFAEAADGLSLTSSMVSSMASSALASGGRTINLEDASDSTLTGAITDILITHGSEIPPKGYYRIVQSGDAEMYAKGGGRGSGSSGGGSHNPVVQKRKVRVFLNVKKESSWDRSAQRPCVTAMAVIFPDRNEFVPPGFCVVKKYKSRSGIPGSYSSSSGKAETENAPANLNHGTMGERVFLCYRRSREGNPITGIIPLQPWRNEPIPEGYTVLERTPRNFVADTNCGAGPPVFLAFRQRLANLEPLRPIPLVLSVLYTMSNNAKEEDQSHSRRKHRKDANRLRAYYCTGGTVVPSEVRRFHIMDRTTHPLLSPSSISNRLALIQASRMKQRGEGSADNSPLGGSSSGYVSSAQKSHHHHGRKNRVAAHTAATESFRFLLDYGLHSNAGDTELESLASSSSMDTTDSHRDLLPSISSVSSIDMSGDEGGYSSSPNVPHQHSGDEPSSGSGTGTQPPGHDAGRLASDDELLQRCFSAMEFIPSIEQAFDPQSFDDVKSARLLLQARIAALTPILTACYTQHGGSGLVAVEGLSSLLNDTDFFKMDVAMNTDEQLKADNALDCSTRLTLLDLSTQVVCDVATSTSRETIFLACVEFVRDAVSFARAQMNTRTIGYALRFYLFVFYFGASIPISSSWPTSVLKESNPNNPFAIDEDITRGFILNEPESSPQSGKKAYLPGGAPQAAALALKELVTLVLARVRAMSPIGLRAFEEEARQSWGGGGATDEDGEDSDDPLSGMMKGMLSTLVDSAVHRVDVANYTQLALHQIHRSGGSELFWHDMMYSCGTGLFGNDEVISDETRRCYTMSFAIMANLVKNASGRVRRIAETSALMPRDVVSKHLSFELLLHCLVRWRDEVTLMKGTKGWSASVDNMAYCVRRLVVPCLLSNTGSGLEDKRVFRRIMLVISELWKTQYYRTSMRMELGVLIEHFMVKILLFGPQVLVPSRLHDLEGHGLTSALLSEIREPLLSQQLDIVTELKGWFECRPADLLEMFVNYDIDHSLEQGTVNASVPGSQWKLCQRLCFAMCTIGEQCSEIISEQIRNVSQHTSTQSSSSTKGEDLTEMTMVRDRARFLQGRTFEAVAVLMQSFGEGLIYSGDDDHSLASLPAMKSPPSGDPVPTSFTFDEVHKSGENAAASSKVLSPKSPSSNPSSPRKSAIGKIGTQNRRGDEEGIVEYWQSSIAERRHHKRAPTGIASGGVVPPPPRLKRAMHDPFNVKNGLEASSSSSLRNEEKTDDTLNTAFEIMKTKSLKKALDYLVACNFLAPSPRDIASFLRMHQAQMDSAVLGDYLGEGGKDGTEVEYWNLIRFNYVRAISFVGMNVEQGLRHFLTNCGFRLPGEAQRIDRIMTTFAQCYWEDNAGDHVRCPYRDQDTIFLIAFAIIMLNTDLHKATPQTPRNSRKTRKKMTKAEFLNNLRGVDNAEELSRDYLSNIYDSIEAHPITILYGRPEESGPGRSSSEGHITDRHFAEGLHTKVKAFIKGAKPAEELLRGLSVHEYPFHDVQGISLQEGSASEISKSALGKTWHHFHSVVKTTLDSAHIDPTGMDSCLDILKFALCATIYLDMHVERSAFITQLARVRLFKGKHESSRRSHKTKEVQQHDSKAFKQEVWYVKLQKELRSKSSSGKENAMQQIHAIFDDLNSSDKSDSQARKHMLNVARRIENGQILLNDPTRVFKLEGDLVKKSNRTGRAATYRFFLFSDILIYTKLTSSSKYRIHEELPLHLIKILEAPDGPKKLLQRSFMVRHPRKSFLVVASNTVVRNMWVDKIQRAMKAELERKARLEGARLASAAVNR